MAVCLNIFLGQQILYGVLLFRIGSVVPFPVTINPQKAGWLLKIRTWLDSVNNMCGVWLLPKHLGDLEANLI